MTVGLVLGGAGSRGDFQVGAARLLYDRGIRWSVITGASGGAIVALKLAEGPDAVLDAERLFLSLRSNDEIFTLKPWLGGVGEEAARLERAADDIGELLLLDALLPGVLIGLVGGEVVRGVDIYQRAVVDSSAYDAAPLQRLLRANIDLAAVASSGIKLRIAVVGLESGELRYVAEDGRFLDDPVRSDPPRCGELRRDLDAIGLRINALEETRAALDPLDPVDKIELVQVKARLSSEQETQNTLLTEFTRLGCHPATPGDAIRGAMASGAMPGFFAPVDLEGQSYVDGGLRTLLPINTAVDAGADDLYAIYPKPGTTFEPSLRPARMLTAALRSIDLMLDEIRRRDLEQGRARAGKLTTIQATLEVHDELTVEPGQTSISMAYGYMRASDVVDGPGRDEAALRTLSDLITRSRLTCWLYEHFIHGFDPPPAKRPLFPASSRRRALVRIVDPAAVPALRFRKWLLRQLVEQRIARGGAVPADHSTWSEHWERHTWDPRNPSPWDVLIGPPGKAEALPFAMYSPDDVAVQEASSADVFVVRGATRFSPRTGSAVDPAPVLLDDGVLAFIPYGGELPIRAPGPVGLDECAGIRQELDLLTEEVARLNEVLGELDPRLASDDLVRDEITERMRAIEVERGVLDRRAMQLGC